ncbi:MAG: hypothetical protein Q8R98_03670 [Rubrivivax sp.]|nr:hypothetical protein [Rubrivivax sp.]MDP3610926.1 hypothetical protein [Rubrivivax sp.]
MAKGALIAALSVVAVLAGCASVQTEEVNKDRAMRVPPERVLAAEPPDANASIIVVRDWAMPAASCYWGLYVDGQLAARIGNIERVDLRVKAGEVKISTARDPMGKGLCGNVLGAQEIQRSTTIEAGATKVFRLMMLGTGGLDIVRADQ